MYDIYEMNADGKPAAARDAWVSGEASTAARAVLRDRARVVARRQVDRVREPRDGPSDIFVMRRDGKEREAADVDGRRTMHPTWSPDGKRIAFVRGKTGRDLRS